MPNDRTDSPVERAHFPWRLMTLHRNFKWRTSTQKMCAHARVRFMVASHTRMHKRPTRNRTWPITSC
jgi:hypothetical protein